MNKYIKSPRVELIEKIIIEELEKRKEEVFDLVMQEQMERAMNAQVGQIAAGGGVLPPPTPNIYDKIEPDSFDCHCVYEAVNKGNTTLWIEFLTLSCFDLSDESGNKITKWMFLKIRFQNPELAEEAKELKLQKTKIDFLRFYDDWNEAIEDFKREFEFYSSGDENGYIIHLDILNFKTFFADPTFYEKDCTDKDS